MSETYFRIYCNEKKEKRGRPICGELLADIPLDKAFRVRLYCRNCQPAKLHEYTYNGDGVIEKRVVDKEEILNLNSSIVVLEQAHG